MKEIEHLPHEDQNELKRVKRILNRGNSHCLDRDLHKLKGDFGGLIELHLYDPLQINIINTFLFRDEDGAKHAIAYAEAMDSGEDEEPSQ